MNQQQYEERQIELDQTLERVRSAFWAAESMYQLGLIGDRELQQKRKLYDEAQKAWEDFMEHAHEM